MYVWILGALYAWQKSNHGEYQDLGVDLGTSGEGQLDLEGWDHPD